MFRLSERAESWFIHISDTPPLTIKFDIFYICAVLGLASAHRARVDDGKDLVQRYPQAYQSARYGILAILLSAEMKILGVIPSDRAAVERLIRDYINPEDQTSLSKAGFDALNEYASGGFAILCERLGEPPRDLPPFLIAVSQLINEFGKAA